MKKVFFALAALTVMSLGSCKKSDGKKTCAHCVTQGTVSNTYCKEDDEQTYEVNQTYCSYGNGTWVIE